MVKIVTKNICALDESSLIIIGRVNSNILLHEITIKALTTGEQKIVAKSTIIVSDSIGEKTLKTNLKIPPEPTPTKI